MEEKHIHHTAGGSDLIPDALRMNPYIVPDGYFEVLNLRILQRCGPTEQALAAWDVPSGYFEQLEADINAKIAEQKLKELVSDSGFSVPGHYFDHLAEQSLAETTLRERVVDPGFVVPANYFNTLQHNISGHLSEREEVPVRKLGKSSPRLLYAAAACIALLLTTWGIFNRLADNPTVGTSLASVSEQEIFNYLELYGSSDDIVFISEHLDNVGERNIGYGLSEEDIEAYLNHTL